MNAPELFALCTRNTAPPPPKDKLKLPLPRLFILCFFILHRLADRSKTRSELGGTGLGRSSSQKFGKVVPRLANTQAATTLELHLSVLVPVAAADVAAVPMPTRPLYHQFLSAIGW